MHWLSLFLKKHVSEGFPTPLTFAYFMLTVVIKTYCIDVVVDIKPIYLNKRSLFQNKVYYLDKMYLFFLKIKLSKFTLNKVNLLPD